MLFIVCLFIYCIVYDVFNAVATGVSDPKEEKEEEEICSVLGRGSPVGTGRPGRGWRSSRAARQRDPDGPRASRARTGSLQLVCKAEPNSDQLEYGTWAAPAREPAERGAPRHERPRRCET